MAVTKITIKETNEQMRPIDQGRAAVIFRQNLGKQLVEKYIIPKVSTESGVFVSNEPSESKS